MSSSNFTAKDLMEIGSTEFTSFVTSYYQGVVPIMPPPNSRPIDLPLHYMTYRGISTEDAKRLGMFWCDKGKYANRLIFPVWEDDKLVYWQARAMWDSKEKGFLKALNPPKCPGTAVSSDVFMNLNSARFYPRVCITEGPIDCIHTGPDAVASFGKSLSAVQIAKLWRAGVRAIDLMWDADARESTLGIAPLLAQMFDLRIVWLPEKDPGSYTRDYLTYLRRHAQPFCKRSLLGAIP